MKLRELSKSIGCSQKEALGILVSLWLWGINNATREGELRGSDREDIKDALSTGLSTGLSTDKVVDSLLERHWIDKINGVFYLHDWDIWQEQWYKALNRRDYDASRKRAIRNQKSNTCPPDIPQDSPPESPVQPSPSPSPSPIIDREIDIEATEQEKIDKALKAINDEAVVMEGMGSISPEFYQDCKIRLQEGADKNLIIKALSIAATKAKGNNGSKCRYAITILQGWSADGIKTLAQWTEKNTPEHDKSNDERRGSSGGTGINRTNTGARPGFKELE